MSQYFTAENLKALLAKANPHELVYLAAGYYVGAHYSANVVAWVTAFLTK